MIFKRIFIEQWATWFMSLILAGIVWGYLFYESTDSLSLEVDVRVEGVDREIIQSIRLLDKVGKPLEGNRVKIVVTGSKGVVSSLRNREITCTYYVENLVDNPHVLVLRRENFNLPSEVAVTFVDGPELKMVYERLVEVQAKLVPTRPDPRHQPASDFVFEGYEVTPPIVRVRVPESKRETVLANGIPLEAPDITGWAFTRSAAVIPQVEFPVKILGNVQLQVLIKIKRVSKTIQKVPINIMYNPTLRNPKVEVTGATTCDVTVEGRESVLNGLTMNSLRAYVFIDQEPTVDGRIVTAPIEIRLLMPEEQRSAVSVVKVDPQNANVKLFLQK
jgi:hypothetical protein